MSARARGEITPERLARLPAWARDKIETQGRDLRDLREKLRESSGASGDKRIGWGFDYSTGAPDGCIAYIPTDQHVEFNLTPGNDPVDDHAVVRVTLEREVKGDKWQLRVAGIEGLAVLPVVSNVVLVEMAPESRCYRRAVIRRRKAAEGEPK